MDKNQKIEKFTTLAHSVQIKTSPEKIWQFLVNLEDNYKTWHPKDHILFKWTEGAPMAKDSKIYSEQYMVGKKVKYKAKIAESVINKKLTITFSFPMSVTVKKIEWIIEDNGDYSTFTAISYMKFGWYMRTFYKKTILELIEDHNKHTAFEGENLKKILENTNK